jgi:hypothetical protein
MIVFYFDWFLNNIATLIIILPTMIPEIQKLTAKMGVSIQNNIHFGNVFKVLHTARSV